MSQIVLQQGKSVKATISGLDPDNAPATVTNPQASILSGSGVTVTQDSQNPFSFTVANSNTVEGTTAVAVVDFTAVNANGNVLHSQQGFSAIGPNPANHIAVAFTDPA